MRNALIAFVACAAFASAWWVQLPGAGFGSTPPDYNYYYPGYVYYAGPYYYPYVYYPHSFQKPQQYNNMYHRYDPSMQIPVYNKSWYNFYPTEKPYHSGSHYILDVF